MPPTRRATAREGLRHLLRHPLRTALTAFTCAVAIAVTVNVISLVYGLDADVRRDLDRLGRRTIDVGRAPILLPRMERRPLGPAEAERIREAVEDLGAVVAPRRQGAGLVRGAGEARPLPVNGVSPTWLETLDVPLAAGRWLEAGDAAVAVLDESAARALFPGRPPRAVVGTDVEVQVGERVTRRRVVGVLADPMTYRDLFEAFDEGKGARTLTSTLLSFRNVYVPLDDDLLGGGDYASVSVVLPDDRAVDEAARRLGAIWPSSTQDLTRITSSVVVFVRRTWMEGLGASSQMGAFLGNAVWVIIVLVAVVMISTLNLLTIRERYDELAIRRVEGARRRDVALQVTVEGTLTAIAGGLAGLPLGFVGAAVLRQIVRFPFRFEARYAVIATGVAVLLGLLSSALPARRAAGLQPTRVLGRRLT